jgi:hypothetical protein
LFSTVMGGALRLMNIPPDNYTAVVAQSPVPDPTPIGEIDGGAD